MMNICPSHSSQLRRPVNKKLSMTGHTIQLCLFLKKSFQFGINNCLSFCFASLAVQPCFSLFAKMRVMCYERYPRFHTFWGLLEMERPAVHITEHPCSWLPPASKSHRQPERQLRIERIRDQDKGGKSQNCKNKCQPNSF